MGLLDVLSANPYVAAGTVAAVGVAAMALSRKKQSDHPAHIPLTMPTKVYDEFVAAMPDEAIAGKVVAITGCTSGVGYFTALTAAQKGAKCVFLLNRPSERASLALASISSKGADGCEVVNIPCDLSDFGSVKKAAATVAAKAKALGGLNALACNAAVMMSPEVVTKDVDLDRQEVSRTARPPTSPSLSPFLLATCLLRSPSPARCASALPPSWH